MIITLTFAIVQLFKVEERITLASQLPNQTMKIYHQIQSS